MGKLKTSILFAAVAAVALTAGFFLPPSAYLGLVALLLLLLIAAMALIAQFERPFLGFALLVLLGVALPLEFRGPSGAMVSMPLAVAAFVCGVWILRLTVTRHVVDVDPSGIVYAALTLIAIPLLAFAAGQLPWFSSGAAPLPVQVAELALFLLSGCLFLAAGHQLTLTHLKWLTGLLVCAGLITCALQMMPSLRFIARWTTRPGSVGSLFWTWLVAVTAAQALFNRKLAPLVRIALAGVTLLVLYHGLVQVRSWASGWAPALAALGVIVLFRLPRLTIGVGIVSIPIALFFQDVISSQLVGDEQYSLLTRAEAWRVLWRLVERSPLIGTGPVNYYYYTENFSILGWYVKFFSHNNYQDLLLQTGILGFAAFCWFAFEVFWLSLRLYRHVPDGFAKAYAMGAMGGLAGSLVAGLLGDWIIPFYYNGGIIGFRSSLLFWVFLGGLLTLKRQYPIRTREVVPSPVIALGLSPSYAAALESR